MAEGGRPIQIINVTSPSVNLYPQNVQELNIKDSRVGKIQITDNATGQNQRDERELQADSATSHLNDPPAFDSEKLPEQTLKPNDSPRGPGWVKLKEDIYMCNQQRLRKHSKVFKGKQRCAGKWRDVAVKLIEYDEKNLNEIKLHLKLEEHPNIVRMFAAGVVTTGCTPEIYIVMELCPQTLKDFMEEHKQKFNLELCFSYAKQIVSGVAFIHSKEILHRDIKLENILISTSQEFIRMADFGLGKQLHYGTSTASVSSRGLGTDGYQAPEMLAKIPKASLRSDSFSIGIVLSMIFAEGQHPAGPDPLRWRTNIVDNKLTSPNIIEFPERYSRKRDLLLDLIKKCLSHNPHERPTPEEMLQHPFFSGNADAVETNQASNQTSNQASNQTFNQASNQASKQASDQASNQVSNPASDQTSNQTSNHASNQASDQASDQVRIKFLEDELKTPLKEIGYEKSSELLEELKQLRGSDELDILLQISECQLYLKSSKRDSSIKSIMHYLSTGGLRPASDVRKMAYNLQQQAHYVQAMILYKISHDLRMQIKDSSAEERMKWIPIAIVDISYAIEPLVKEKGTSRDIAVDYGLRYMNEMLTELKAVKNASKSSKVLKKLACFVTIVFINIRIGDYKECKRLCDEGLEMMEQHFRDKASNHKDYGKLLNSLGVAHKNLGEHAKAKHCYEKAMKAFKNAHYESKEEKEECLNLSKRNLENLKK